MTVAGNGMNVTAGRILSEPMQLDTFLRDAELEHRRTFYPWGFPFEVETNSVDVIEAAADAWGPFAQDCGDSAVRLCLAVTNSDAPLSTPRSTFASREHLMSLYGDAEHFVLFDFARGFAFGSITRATARDHALVRYRFLTAALTLVEQRWLAPLHGAFIAKNGAGVLLCGDSMAGKSTLSYACCREGWTYITDDGMSLLRARPDLYGVGDYTTLRLREDARRFFPELGGRAAVVRPNGKLAIEIPTAELRIATAAGHSVDHVVFLNRQQECEVSLQRYPAEEALARWEPHASFGPTEVRRAQRQCHLRLIEVGVWELNYSALRDATAALNQLIASPGPV